MKNTYPKKSQGMLTLPIAQQSYLLICMVYLLTRKKHGLAFWVYLTFSRLRLTLLVPLGLARSNSAAWRPNKLKNLGPAFFRSRENTMQTSKEPLPANLVIIRTLWSHLYSIRDTRLEYYRKDSVRKPLRKIVCQLGSSCLDITSEAR